MGVKDILSTGAMLIIGVIALKAFGGVKGLTSMLGGIGDLLGTGTTTTAAVDVVTLEDIEQVEAIGELTQEEIDLLAESKRLASTYDIIDTLAWVGGPMWAAAMPHLTQMFEDYAKADLLSQFEAETEPEPTYEPSGSVPTYTHPIPTDEPVYQPSAVVPSDPGHPATDPWLGGR